MQSGEKFYHIFNYRWGGEKKLLEIIIEDVMSKTSHDTEP